MLTLVGALTMLALAAPATADHAMLFGVDFLKAGASHPKSRASVWVAGRRVRIQQGTPGTRVSGPTLIYRGDRDRFYSLDAKSKYYIEVDREMIAAVGQQIQAARREINSQLSSLPLDQQKAFERLLGVTGRDHGSAAAPVIVKELAATEEILGMTCRGRLLSRGGKDVGRACVVEWSMVGLDRHDMEVFRQLGNFQRELMGARGLTPLELVPNQPLDILAQLDGFPMYYHRLHKGKTKSTIKVVSLDVVRIEPGWFDVPADYTLRSGFSSMLSAMGSMQAEPPASPDPQSAEPAESAE